jgi:hypothetical protein
VSSGNSLNCGPEDRATLDASGACLKEMEAAAIAYVAHLFGVPLLAVKAVTDIVDGDKVSGEQRCCARLFLCVQRGRGMQSSRGRVALRAALCVRVCACARSPCVALRPCIAPSVLLSSS